jgi:predicted DNA-binding antitoxin AbrB/MazE fold protein
MSTIHAIFEDGVFRPREPVELPEGSEVEFEPRIVPPGDSENDALARVYELLGRRFESGEHDVAARHNEHQP